MGDKFNDEFLSHNSSLLLLSLPDNDQTWLYCLPESDPNTLFDLSNFLCWNSSFKQQCALVPVEDDTRNDQINTTFCLPESQCTSKNRRTKLKHHNINNTSCAEDSSNTKGNSTIHSTLPIQSAQLNHDCNTTDNSRIELDDTNLVAQLTVEESPKINAKVSICSNQESTLKSSSNSWNISERTLLFNISAPSGFMDSTSTSHPKSSSDCSLFSKLNFNPNSVSTPTKKLTVSVDTDEISTTPDIMNKALIDTNTIEDRVNNTYDVSLSNMESNDQSDNINFNITPTISTSNNEIAKPTDAIEELGEKNTLQNTYICEESIAEQFSANNTKIITNSNENLISTEDSVNNKLDEPLNFPYNSETDLNSTITIKSKDNDDSGEDSCYSSSSNIRSLGDVCDMVSQSQAQKNSNVDCILTKTRSEDSLCLPDDASNSRKPKNYYGSALNLGTHSINQLAADRRLHQNPNYFLRKPGNQVALPNVSSQQNNAKCMNTEKTILPTRTSKIPRLQSKIPKLVSKK